MANSALNSYFSKTLINLGYDEYEDEGLISWSLNYSQSDYVSFDQTYLCETSVMAVAKRLFGSEQRNLTQAIGRIYASGKTLELSVGGSFRSEISCNGDITALQQNACDKLLEYIDDELKTLSCQFIRDGLSFYFDATVCDNETILDRTFGPYQFEIAIIRPEVIYDFGDVGSMSFNMESMRAFIDGKDRYFDARLTLSQINEDDEFDEVTKIYLSTITCSSELSNKNIISLIKTEYGDQFREVFDEARRLLNKERPERDMFFYERHLAQQKAIAEKREQEALERRKEELEEAKLAEFNSWVAIANAMNPTAKIF
ncbi:hypothetical protein [Photobacterium damselae]|uniref:hypothetical protein n=1 Tax=Photobacterium damselae TaxID=38293 RepID=UPI000D666D68|nr:hypothetical protein [Photobacterium damselae]AWK84518.1 hypothetical protein BST98_21020 [Photobacterium damselae]MBE8127792.1 hypothetical protein [Photobacterium damselae subsp. piscicida]TLS85788.1 hypothetical protein FD720_14275 [Photobacterium damselae subsp. damselae]WIH21811.1 hypothetical protein KQY33_20470 [Photobacterium damselae]